MEQLAYFTGREGKAIQISSSQITETKFGKTLSFSGSTRDRQAGHMGHKILAGTVMVAGSGYVTREWVPP